MLKMEEFYKVLKYLDYAKVDRHLPCQDYFYEWIVDEETGEVTENKKEFIGNDLLFETNRESYKGINSVEILIKADTPFISTDLTFEFSEYIEGYVPVLTLPATKEINVPSDEITKIVFELEEIRTMREPSYFLTALQTVRINHNLPDVEFTVMDIVFKTAEKLYSLEDIADEILEGEKYVISKLQLKNIIKVPESIDYLTYKSAAAWTWLGLWEFEGRKMNDEQKNAKSYGVRLLTEVDEAIERYKDANDLNKEDDVKQEIATNTILEWWK